jgi:hypothetical protein
MVTSQFQQAMAQAPSEASRTPQANLTDDSAMQILETAEDIHLESNPYPNSMNQTVIQPLDHGHVLQSARPQQPAVPERPSVPSRDAQPAQAPVAPVITRPTSTPEKPATPAVSSDIMRLANNSSHLSVEALAHEAHRLENKDSEEVVIDLR